MQVLETPTQAAQWLRRCGCDYLETDSRKLTPGDGFVAWPGLGSDARHFVPLALAQGARACLVEHAGADRFHFDDDRIVCYRGLKADAGVIASEFFAQPSKQMSLVAVTGTNGKTSVAWWLAHALSDLAENLQKPCGLIGTLGVGSIATSLVRTGFTTPDPVFLQRTLRQFVDQGLQACAMEASSIGIEEHRLAGTHVHTAIFTNFTQDHLDYHGSMDAYWHAKVKLFSWPGLVCAVVNVDDAKGAELARTLSAQGLDVWTVSCKQQARLQARNVIYHEQGLFFDVVEGDVVVAMQTLALGTYNVHNFLCVLAAMRSLQIPLVQAVRACSALSPVPGRMECIGGSAQPLIAVDYAHTPDALAHALQALRPLATRRHGKLWCVFGCGGDRDATKRAHMGAIAAQYADHVVLTSDNPRSESPEAIVAQILQGMPAPTSAQVQLDRAQAVAVAVAQATSSDVILLAGKGHEEVQEIAGAAYPFSDKVQAIHALELRSKLAHGVRA